MSDQGENFPDSDCIIDPRKPASSGYVNVNWSRFGIRHQGYAHRLAWAEANGPIPEGMAVLHRCDVRTCVNVEHLFLGTLIDNNMDRDRKGRTRNQYTGRLVDG